MERWQAERVKNLQEEIEQLEYESEYINDLQACGFSLDDNVTNLGFTYFLEEDEMDKIRDILLKCVNREIIRLEKELGDV